MSVQFDLAAFDPILSARTTPQEWQRILSFRSQPGFLNALRMNHARIPEYFSNNMVLNKVVTEAQRFEILVYTLYLYDTRDPANPRSGLTVSNLQKLCARQKCASGGRVVAILGIMRIGGYLQMKASVADSRVKHLEPTEKFVSVVEGWNNLVFQIIDTAFPEGNLAQRHLTGHRFGWEMRNRGAERLLDGWKLLDPFPEVNFFVMSDGGWMLLLHCVAMALLRSGGAQIDPVSVDLKAFGKRFGVSRSHLRRLLERAYAEGLLTAPPQNGSHIALSPLLAASYLGCFASQMSFYRENALQPLGSLAAAGSDTIRVFA